MTTIHIPMDLENLCWNCEGTGVTTDNRFKNDDGKCDQCDGTGYIRTDFGNAVLDFMQRHGGQK